MRLLHTSDWHVGRSFYGHDLLADQEAVLTALAGLVVEHGVDAVLISGDLYDRAVPSAAAVGVATRALQRIRDAGAVIVATAGNHDSAPRLGAFAGFLAAGGLHLATDPAQVGRPVMLPDPAGAVAVYPIPYLEPDIVRHRWGLAPPASHHAILAAAMDRIRADLATRPVGTRSVVLAHAFVVGAVPGGSERSIAVGGVEVVTGEIFNGIDYVALGHLHGAQMLSERLRYSGSVLPYSFTETAQRKSVWLVDLAADGAVAATRLDLPVIRPLAVVRGRLDEIVSSRPDLAGHYLSIELTDPVRPLEPMRVLRQVFPYAMTVNWQPPSGAGTAPGYPSAGPGVGDAEVISAFLAECRGADASPAEQAVLDRALADLRIGQTVR